MSGIRPIDQFLGILRGQEFAYVENFDIISDDYNKGHWQSNAQETVEPTPEWHGAIVDGIPCLFRQFDDPDDTELLRKSNKQAHIARSYLKQHQVIDLHVFAFLVGAEPDALRLSSSKNELEEDGKIARKCAEIFIEGEDETSVTAKCNKMLARSPFSPVFRKIQTEENGSEELNFLDWEGRLRTFIEAERSLSSRTDGVLQAFVDEIRNIHNASGQEADSWPRRLSDIVVGPGK